MEDHMPHQTSSHNDNNHKNTHRIETYNNNFEINVIYSILLCIDRDG